MTVPINMPPKDQALSVDSGGRSLSGGKSLNNGVKPAQFLFDAKLSTAIAANGQLQAEVPKPKGLLPPESPPGGKTVR